MVTKKITLATKSKIYFFLSLTLITVAILSVVLYFGADAYFDSRLEVAEASEEVRSLFKDPQHIYLADGITE